MNFETLQAATRWYTAVVTNLRGVFGNALFHGICEGSAASDLRHFKAASRKPRKIRPFCTLGLAGVAPREGHFGIIQRQTEGCSTGF
jgi:hypothetical protein